MTDSNFMKLRFDFDPEVDNPYEILAIIFNAEQPDFIFPLGVIGIENMNKYGDVIKTHLHYNFQTTEKPDTIRKRIMRAFKRPKGWYSLAQETDVLDMDRFFRYPTKQYEEYVFPKFQTELNGVRITLPRSRFPLPADFDMVLQNKLAYEEWVQKRDFLRASRDKQHGKKSTFEKIMEEINAKNTTFTGEYEIYMYLLDYYEAHNLVVERFKIRNMIDTIALRTGLIDRRVFFERMTP